MDEFETMKVQFFSIIGHQLKSSMDKLNADASTPSSRKKAAQQRHLKEKRARDKQHYLKNREKKIEQVKQCRQEKRELLKGYPRTRKQIKEHDHRTRAGKISSSRTYASLTPTTITHFEYTKNVKSVSPLLKQ